MENLSNFEMLPDEMILYVCQYLRNAEILYSFFNLNTRLNSTITDYYRRVNLKNVTYKQFNFVTMKIIPEIGSFIESFVFNGPWESIMFKSPNSIFSKAKLSSIFPQLRRMSIVGFIDQQLNEFLEKITDFPHLVKLDIRSAQVDGQEDSLKKLLAANSDRLKSIMFDYDSMDFVLESNKNEETISFTNIEELALNLKTDKIFGSLFMLVPNVTRLYIDFDETSSTSTTIITNIPSLIYLKDFRLRSLDTDWSLNEISFILNKMPSLQRLALDLPTTDFNLINGNNFLKVLPLSLVEIHFFIIYKHLMSPQEIDNLVSTWPNYPQIACLEYKSADYMVIHTMPCDFISINIPASVAKKMFVGSNYTRKVRDLKIFGDQNSTDIHSILQHFQRIRTLTIGSKNQQKENPPQPTQPIVLHLPCLKRINMRGTCDLFPIVQSAPNLENIKMEFNCFNDILNNTNACELLQKRIVHLELTDIQDFSLIPLDKIATIFNNLRDLSLWLENLSVFIDSLILKVLSMWKDKNLRSLYMKGKLTDEVSQNLQQWLIDHSHLTQEDLFFVEYESNWTVIWLH